MGPPAVSPSFFLKVIGKGCSIPSLKEKEFRKYVSNVTGLCRIRGCREYVDIPIQYEIGAHEQLGTGGTAFKADVWRELLRGSGPAFNTKYSAPAEVREHLPLTEREFFSETKWGHFNFDSVVQTLGGMAAALTLKEDLTTDILRGEDYKVRKVGATEATDADNEGTVVLFEPFLCGHMTREAQWVLATAIQLSGSEVVISHLDPDVSDGPECLEVGGAALMGGISLCLNALAPYYSMAGRGDSFAYALVTGIHRVLCVVAHSDEGGWFRDALREGTFCKPFGGIPSTLPLDDTIRFSFDGNCSQFTAMVDGIALASAAAVAHCDPVRCGAYDSRNKSSPYLYFPTLVIIRAPKSSEEKIQGIAAAVESHGSFDRFCYQFAVALHLLFSLRSDGHVYAANYLRSAISSLAVKGSGTTTVTTVGVFAPYFFIEPTTILPKDVFGFAAETEGFAALVTPGEGAKMPFFERAEPVAKCRHVSEWILTYRSARTCGMVLFAMNSGEDGLDEMQIRDFDHDMFVLTRLSHEEMLRRKRNRGFVTPADLLWVRGLSKLPHPAEMIQGCGRLRMTLVHRDLKHGRESRPTPYIPDPDDAQLAELTLNASKPAFCCCGKSDQKSRGVSRIITCGATKLEQSLLGRR